MASRVRALVSSSGRVGMERVVVARSLAVDVHVDAVWCVPSSSESNRSSKASNSVREEEGLADGGASSISRSSAREEGEGLLGVGVRGVGGCSRKAAAHPGDGQRSAHGWGGSGRFLRVAVALPCGRGGLVAKYGFSIIMDACALAWNLKRKGEKRGGKLVKK